MRGWNATCQPPWSEAELQHKVTSARERIDPGKLGHLANANCNGSPSGHRTERNGEVAREPQCRNGDLRYDDRPAEESVGKSGNEEHDHQVSQDELPVIDAGNEDLASVTPAAWAALAVANNPPTIFRHGAQPARIETDDDGTPMVRPLNLDRLRHRMARVARWEKTVQRGGKTAITLVAPPIPVIKDMLAQPDPPLPILTRIVEAPILAPDGSLQTTPGYSPSSRTFYAPATGFDVPAIPQNPTLGAVAEALNAIHELVCDFPFVGDAERAHAIACLLLPFVRDMIDGPTPLHLFEASTAGTGKTLLVELLTYPFLGRPVTVMTEGRDEDEWRKRVFAKLRSGPSVLQIDNLKRRLESGAVASVITAWPLWEDRLLGVSEIVRVPVRCLWIATGNNPALSSELTRRTVRCRLDARIDRPWLRDGFRHPDIRCWAKARRGELVAAALTLIQSWIAAGQPLGSKTLGMFETWAKVMGGILDVAGVPGFLGNLEEFYERADTDAATWSGFMEAWYAANGSSEVKAADLWRLATEAGLDLGDGKEASQKIRLGKLLRQQRDRVFAVGETRLRVEAAGTFRRATLWKLVLCECGNIDTHTQELPD
jgi:hypothetical protein